MFIIDHYRQLLYHKKGFHDREPKVVALFGVLSADDDEADYHEFLSGALKMKGSARTIDAVQILHQGFSSDIYSRG